MSIVVLLICLVCTMLHVTNSEPHAYVMLHLEYFVIVKCVVCSFGFSVTFCFACSSSFFEMIAYVSAMFDFIAFHQGVTNSSIK